MGRYCANTGGLVIMKSIPVGKACVKSSIEMVLASMGRRVSHPRIASGGRRWGLLVWRRVSRCDTPVSASESVSAHVYEATTWPLFFYASRPVTIPPQSSTKRNGLWGGRLDQTCASEGVGVEAEDGCHSVEVLSVGVYVGRSSPEIWR